MATTHNVDFEEKQVYDATIQDVPSDGASSIDTITALVNEGAYTCLELQFNNLLRSCSKD